MRVGIEQLSLSSLRTDRSLPRVSINTIEKVRQHGQILPVVVRPTDNAHHYEILANAESWLTVQKAGLHSVEILIRDNLDDQQAADIINHSGPTMDPITEAEWFRMCLDGLWQGRRFDNTTELARFIGRSRSYVAHALRLLKLSPAIQAGVRAGALKVGHAKAILSLSNTNERATFSTRIIQQRWSVRRAEYEARLQRLGTTTKTQKKSITTQALERDIGKHLGCRVEIDEATGHITIDYCRDLDILDGVLQRCGYPIN